MNVQTIRDRRFDGIDAPALDIRDGAAVAATVARACDDGVDALVVVGDDATLSALASAYAAFGRTRSELLMFAPLATGSPATAAEAVGADRATPRRLRKLVQRLEQDRGRRQSLHTLHIVDSARPAARLAFSFGMGAVTQLFAVEGRVRRRDAVRYALGGNEPIEADVFVDWAREKSRFGVLLASSLQRSWAGVKMGDPPTYRLGGSAMELVRGATRVGRLVERASGGSAQEFGRIHIDTNSDYVVDGVVYESSCPRLIALTPGPQLRLLA